MKDFYKELMIDTLKDYSHAKIFISNVGDQIEALEAKKDKNLISKYGDCQKGEGKSCEDNILDINAKIDLLKKNYKDGKNLIKNVEKAMSSLSDEEIDITLKVYGNIEKKSNISYLIDTYHYEKTQIYRIANYCLKYISKNMYGGC